MTSESRKDIRFDDFGRVECPELCVVGGILEDVSMNGCKIQFNAPVSLNAEEDYELKVRLSKNPGTPLTLICHPQWQKVIDGQTHEIGFEILHSPDSGRLHDYISHLYSEQSEYNDQDIIPVETECQFV